MVDLIAEGSAPTSSVPAAARQCNRVLPSVPYRQWVLSLPWELRMPVARDTALLNAVSRVFFEEVREWLRGAAGRMPGAVSEAAAVTYVQRFGGSLNLNPHLHMLVADGVFVCREDGSTPDFVATAAPTRDDLRSVIERVIERLQIIERRRAQRAASESFEVSDDGMEGLRRAAGERGTFARVDEKSARGDAADESDERVFRPLRMRTHRVMSPMEFMARLSALVPPPRTPLVRYHGVLAPNSPWRVAVVPLPPIEEAIGACAERAVAVGGAAVGRSAAAGGSAATAATQADAVRPARAKGGRIEWARLLWRVWKIDALKCPACDGRMTIIAALTERVGIVRVLEHLGISTEVPRMRRTRDGP